MGGRVLAVGTHAQMAPDLRLRAAGLDDADVGAGQVHRGCPRLFHRRGDYVVDGRWFGAHVHVRHCGT
jgi:hypothetical protein